MVKTFVRLVVFDPVEPYGPAANLLRWTRAMHQPPIINTTIYQVPDQAVYATVKCIYKKQASTECKVLDSQVTAKALNASTM